MPPGGINPPGGGANVDPLGDVFVGGLGAAPIVTVPSGFFMAPGGSGAPVGNLKVLLPSAPIFAASKPLGGGTVKVPFGFWTAPAGRAVPVGGAGMVTLPSVPSVAGAVAPVIIAPDWKLVCGMKVAGPLGAPMPVKAAILPLLSTVPKNEGGGIVYVPSTFFVVPVGSLLGSAGAAMTMEPFALTAFGATG